MQCSSTLFANKKSWRVIRKYFYDKVTTFLIVLKSFLLCKSQQDQDKDSDNDIAKMKMTKDLVEQPKVDLHLQ